MNRWTDWWDQAERDVRHAHHAVEDGDHEWSAFAFQQAAARLPALRRVILFGSLVAGIPTPRSDADLLVVLSESDHREPRDRVPEVLRG